MIEEQIERAFDTVNELIDARNDMLQALQHAKRIFEDRPGKKWDGFADMADEALADLDMDARLQALIDAAEELADKLVEENSCD
jgi:arginine/lysine/ornithine decarboxylase